MRGWACSRCARLGAPSPSFIPSPEPISGDTPLAQLEVACDENLELTASSDTVETTSAGVPILVTSEAPAGAYLNHNNGGDPLPADPTVWVLTPSGGLEMRQVRLGLADDDFAEVIGDGVKEGERVVLRSREAAKK